MKKEIASLKKGIINDFNEIENFLGSLDKNNRARILGDHETLPAQIKDMMKDINEEFVDSAESHHYHIISFSLLLKKNMVDLLSGIMLINTTVILETAVHEGDTDKKIIALLKSFIRFLNKIDNVYQKISVAHFANLVSDEGNKNPKGAIFNIVDAVNRYFMLSSPESISKLINNFLNSK